MDSKRQNQEQDPLIGKVIGKKYEITSLIRRGGMARVYKGFQQPLGRIVAIKVLAPQNTSLVPEGVYEKRFFREASVASKLTHPNTVIIHDYGRMDDPPNYYIVMEYLDGITLRQAIQRGAPMPIGRVLHIAEQICGSLMEAHSLGMVHRDLKPANIMLVHRGNDPDFVKVLDFGLVKPVTPSGDEELTVDGTFVGSPGYMAPEQILGESADQRADIYSLGVLIYEMLTGKTPFPVMRQGPQNMGIVYAQLSGQPVPLHLALSNSAVPQYIEKTVMKCLERNPIDRFPSIDKLLSALRGYDLPDSSQDVVAPTVAQRVNHSLPKKQETVTETPLEERQRNVSFRNTVIAAAIGAIIVLIFGMLIGHLFEDKVEHSQISIITDVQQETSTIDDEVVIFFGSSPEGAGVFEGSVSLGLTPVKVRILRSSLMGDRPRVFLIKKDGFAVYRHEQWATDQKEIRVFATLDPEPEVVPKTQTIPKKNP